MLTLFNESDIFYLDLESDEEMGMCSVEFKNI